MSLEIGESAGQELPDVLVSLPSRLRPMDDEVDGVEPQALPTHSSAVMILLYPRAGLTHFLLTVRQDTLRRHAGQISLPGGRAEPEDASLWATALRETEEELGIPRHLPRSLGRLEPHFLFVTGYRIAPFVAWVPRLPILYPDSREVAEVLEVPLDTILDPRSIVEEVWRLRGADWQVVYFRFGNHRIWGATARMLHDLASRLREPRPGEPVPGSVTAVV